MRKNPFTTARIDADLAKNAAEKAELLGWSFNAFIERAAITICRMIDDPASRVLPDAVVMADAVNENHKKPVRLPKKNEISLSAAEEPGKPYAGSGAVPDVSKQNFKKAAV